MSDETPRYTTRRLHIEIERARLIERAECADIARRYSQEFISGLCHYGPADKDEGRGRQEGHIKAGEEIAQLILTRSGGPDQSKPEEAAQ